MFDRRRGMAAIVASVAGAGLVACAETPTERAATPAPVSEAAPAVESAPAPIRPCTYISQAEAEKALGMPLLEPRAGDYDPASMDAACEFDSAGEMQTLALSMRLTHLPDQAAGIERLQQLLGGAAEEVSGLGDRALYGLGQLFVFKDSMQVTVVVTPIVRPPAKRIEARQAVARVVLEKL